MSTLINKILPIEGRRNILITSALPYVNNVPHLGNIIGCVLSADVYSRYCQQRGYNTLYICGTDEYGTATETKAKQEKCTPREICDKYYKIHSEVYEWFDIDFHYFGRTSTPKQTKIAQDIFLKLHKNNLLKEHVTKQYYCTQCNMYLADRFITGICPHCEYPKARGDQCDKCTKLINSINLKEAKCTICSSSPEIRSSKHLFLDLPSLEKQIDTWAKDSIKNGYWSDVAKSVTLNGWLKEGIQERCITRDLKWGTPVPKIMGDDYKDKVFYVWFDAPIGYISITANYTDDWKLWWQKNDKFKVEHFEFMAKDNVPFHSIIFPGTLIGTGGKWNLVNSICSTHYLNYQDQKFSKSNEIGVFGNHAKETNIPVEVWRYYLLSIRPEQNDSKFFWSDLVNANNNELLNNLGNFVNRILKFSYVNFDQKVPCRDKGEWEDIDLTKTDSDFISEVNETLKEYIECLEKIKLKEGLAKCLKLSRIGNGYFQKEKPWVLIKNDKSRCKTVVNISVQLVYTVCSVLGPYLPSFSKQVLAQLNIDVPVKSLPIYKEFNICGVSEEHKLGTPVPIFRKISNKELKEYQKKFAGKKDIMFPVDLRVGQILNVVDHPTNEKLYIFKIDVGDRFRQIVGGVKKTYPDKDELVGKKVIVVVNLESKSVSKIVSNGMLLAETKKRLLHLLEPPSDSVIGTQLVLEKANILGNVDNTLDYQTVKKYLKEIKVDSDHHIQVREYNFLVSGCVLLSKIGKGAKIS